MIYDMIDMIWYQLIPYDSRDLPINEYQYLEIIVRVSACLEKMFQGNHSLEYFQI